MNIFNKIFIGVCLSWLVALYFLTSSDKGKWYEPTKNEIKATCKHKIYEITPIEQQNPDKINGICGCVVDRLEQKHSPKELNELKSDELDRLGLVCTTGDSIAEHTHLAANSRWKITEKIAFVGACKSYFDSNNGDGIYNKLEIAKHCNCLATTLETQHSYQETLKINTTTLIGMMKNCAGKK